MRSVRVVSIVAAPCLVGFVLAISSGFAVAGEVPLVFVSRSIDTATRPVIRAQPVERAPRGKLLIWSGGASVRTLVDAGAPGATAATPTDVMDPDVSWDATRILFTGFSESEHAWRIFEIGVDGNGLRQLTRSDRVVDLARYRDIAPLLEGYDDLDPCYLPDGRICFVSTRYPEIAPDERLRATNLYVVNADGTDLHRITHERFGADTPTVEPSTGRIVYSRWWRTVQALPITEETAVEPNTPAPPAPPPPIPPGSPGYDDAGGDNRDGGRPPAPPGPNPTRIVDEDHVPSSSTVLRGVPAADFPGVNSWFLASIHPDGTGLMMHSGFRLDRQKTQAYKPSFLPDGSVVALFIHETPLLGFPGSNGLRRLGSGAVRPVALGGPQTFRGLAGFPEGFVYASAASLEDGRIVASVAQHPADIPDFDLRIQENRSAPPIRVYGTATSNELDPVPLVTRRVPPVIRDQNDARMAESSPRTLEEAFAQGSFQFVCENVHFNGPVDLAIPGAPPVGTPLLIEFYMAPQRTRVFPPDPPILVASQPIGPDGKIEAELPAGVPLFEVLKRADGSIPRGRDGQIYHVGGLNFGHAGKVARCVGCHAGHSMLEVPVDTQAAAFTNLAPSAIVTASSSRGDVPGFFEPKALVDRRTTPIVAEWAAGGDELVSRVQLRWTVPIEARSVVVYAPASGTGTIGERRQSIRSFTVETYYFWHTQESHLGTTILPEGTAVPLDPTLQFDALIVSMNRRDVSGSSEGSTGPSLAEVEVIARTAGLAKPAHLFVRGDANCDTHFDISDVQSLLGGLFPSGTGGEGFCCMAAADANRDGALNLTDAIYLLNHLFKGGSPPSSPYPGCGRIEEDDFGCDQEACN